MNEIILYLGLGVFIIGGIGLLIAAFRTSILWGLAVLLIAPVAILYLLIHWQDAKGPFKTQVFGFLIILLSAYLSGGINLPSSINSAFSSSPVISNEQLTAPHLNTGRLQELSATRLLN